MANDERIEYDDRGRARHFSLRGGETSLAGATPQESADNFLRSHADELKVAVEGLGSLGVRASTALVEEREALRFDSEKRIMDTTVVSYVQTMFGLPVYEAGVSVTTRGPDNAVIAATSTLHDEMQAVRPPDATRASLRAELAGGGYDDLVRQAFPEQPSLRVHGARLVVYRYEAARRLRPEHVHTSELEGDPPTLPLPPVPPQIEEGVHYVVVEGHFSLAVGEWGVLNWRALIEVETGAVLYLRALVDCATAYVFDVDPITKTGSAANLPTAVAGTLDLVRDTVPLVNLGPVSSGVQKLEGTYVKLVDTDAPIGGSAAPPTQASPFNFFYGSRSDQFAGANAYYHCDRFFRIVSDLGFSVASYFGGTAFPVQVDHRALGNQINAQCPGNSLGTGIGTVKFALADPGPPQLGIAADWRVVLHELAGHGILWNHVHSPNFGFAHSAGDSIAVILNDPDSHAAVTMPVDRFKSFPWMYNVVSRRHDRPVNGWGWGGVNDVGGYSSEQILSTTLFRLYRSLGGDSAYLQSRVFASRATVYLVLRAVAQLTPGTNPGNALGFEQQLETADAGTWVSTNPAETNAGGAYHKVIRWAFEKQGIFRSTGAPATVEGAPPPVDVYIDDGRHGEYPFLPAWWACTDIWNRRTIGAGAGVHEEPVVGQTNYAYVRIKNRGTSSALNVVVKGFHCLPGVGLTYPTDWLPMTTPQLAAPNLAAGDNVGVVVGPFHWTPSQVGHECMFFSVSATGDRSNIEPGLLTGPIPEWRLVPHDNNIGQRNVSPVILNPGPGQPPLSDKLRFWIRNPVGREAVLKLEIRVPKWLDRLGWRVAAPELERNPRLNVQQRREVRLTVTSGRTFTDATLRAQPERDIAVTVLANGAPIGGMTFQIQPRGRGRTPSAPPAAKGAVKRRRTRRA